MQNVPIQDLNTPLIPNLGVNLGRSNENQGDFSDLLQGSIERSEQPKGSLVPEKRQDSTSGAREAARDTHPKENIKEDAHVSKKDTHPHSTEDTAEDTQVSKRGTHPAEDNQVAKKDVKKDNHLKEADQGQTDIQLKQLVENKRDKHLSDQLMTQTNMSDQKIDAKDTANTVLNDLLQPLTAAKALQINPEKEQTSDKQANVDQANPIDPMIALGLMNQLPEKIDNRTEALKTDQADTIDGLQLQAGADNKATHLEQAMLEKLQALVGQQKGLELANALENQPALEPFKEQFAKVDNLKSFNQLVDGLSDSGNKNVQQALQSILGAQKVQDSGALVGTTYKFDMQGKISQQVNDKIIWMTQQDIKQARLVLDPANLGNIDIHISIHKNEATVHFLSNNHLVKDALQANMHQLSAQMAQDGLTLMQSNVQMQQQGRQAFGYEGNTHSPVLSEGIEESVGPARTSGPQDGMLHLYV